jgi:nicotinate phosphoribosyltransferase
MAGAPRQGLGLLADLYELTMAAGYLAAGKAQDIATFELSVRHLPANRSFLVAAGLEQAVEYLLGLSFSGDDIDYLRGLPVFEYTDPRFFQYLRALRFTGEMWALPEGTVVFGEEPLLRVTAPLPQAQIVETFLMATLSYQTMVATKAARLVEAAPGRSMVEFGTRRAHGPDAGLLAARASYIGGCAGTSNMLAGKRWGIPVYGTAAHSWIMAFVEEEEAFRRFLDVFREKTILLVDTYDPLEGARAAVRLGRPFRGVRLDSGDLLAQSVEVRRILDAGGYPEAIIMASGDLDEHKIAALVAQGARLDAFGVGTELVTSRDAPSLNAIYKMVEISRHGRVSYPAKFSEGKVTYPGKKQVFRFPRAGSCEYDVIACEQEDFPDSERLLEPVLREGQPVAPLPSLAEARERAARNLARLPAAVRRLHEPESYPVRRSAALEALLDKARKHSTHHKATKSTKFH